MTLPPRTDTRDLIHFNEAGEKTTTFHLKRACNGCGQHLGDLDDRDVDARGELTDVRAECAHCRPLVVAEAAGCRTWQITERSISRVDFELDRLDVFAKQFTEMVDGKVTTVGLRVGEKPGHVVARFGDWLIGHPDGSFSVHRPAAVGSVVAADTTTGE